MTLSEALAARIEELLKEHDISQYRLSQVSGVSQATISDIRLQKNEAVNVRILYEIMDGLGLGLNYFFNSPLFERENITDVRRKNSEVYKRL